MATEHDVKALNSLATTTSPSVQSPALKNTASPVTTSQHGGNGVATRQLAGSPSPAAPLNVEEILRKRLRVVPDGAISRRYENDVTATEFSAIARSLQAIADGQTRIVIEDRKQNGFKQDIIETLAIILQTQVGRRTISEIAENPRHTTKIAYVTGKNPEVDLDVVGDKRSYYKDTTDKQTGVNAIIELDPKAPFPGSRETKDRGLESRGDIKLFHELVHAHHIITGYQTPGIIESGEDVASADLPVRDSEGRLITYTTKEEYATVGLERGPEGTLRYVTSGKTENAYRAARRKIFKAHQVQGALPDAGLPLRKQYTGTAVGGGQSPVAVPQPPPPMLAALVRSLPPRIGQHALSDLVRSTLPRLGQRRLAEVLSGIAANPKASGFVARHGAPAILALDEASPTRSLNVDKAIGLLGTYPESYQPAYLAARQKDLSQGSIARQLRAASPTLTRYVPNIRKDVDVFIEDESVFADREASYALQNYEVQADSKHEARSAAKAAEVESTARNQARSIGGRTVGSSPGLAVVLNAARADSVAIIHEYIHTFSRSKFSRDSSWLNEGVTQYLTRKIIGELKSSEGRFLGTTFKEYFKMTDREYSNVVYSENVSLVERLVRFIGPTGDDILSREYFQGASGLLQGEIDSRRGPGTFAKLLDLLEKAEQGIISPLAMEHEAKDLLEGINPVGRRPAVSPGRTHK